MQNRDHWSDRNEDRGSRRGSQRHAGGGNRSRGEFNDEDRNGGRSQRHGQNENWHSQDRDGDGRFQSGSRNLGRYGENSGMQYPAGREEDDHGLGDIFGGAGQGSGYRGGGRYESHGGVADRENGDRNRHDDDYHHWRDAQIGKLDEDYNAFRDERRKKFADEFDKWRTDRAGKAGTQAGSEAKR